MITKRIYLCSGEHIHRTLLFGTRHLILKWPGLKHMKIWMTPHWSHSASTDMQGILSFIFNFVAVYLAALNTSVKGSAFGHCREEMKGTNSSFPLVLFFVFFFPQLFTIHGLHMFSSNRRTWIISAPAQRRHEWQLSALITNHVVLICSLVCGSVQHSPFTSSKFSRLQSVMPDTPPLQGNSTTSGRCALMKAVSIGPAYRKCYAK